MERVAVVLLASLIAGASAGAQQIIFTEPQSGGVFFGDVPSPVPGGQPPRDGRPAATGTGQIAGRVLAADSGQPVRKAMVRLSSTELRVSRTSSTDPDGRYDFRDLAAGRYTVSAFKGGYVNIAYGQRRPNQPGKPLQLADKQTLDRIDISLPRGGVIAGRVLDEFGEPIADVQVVPMRNQFTAAGRRPMPSGRPASTDDIGEFRLYGLAPGQYYISATLRNQSFGPDGSDDRSGYAPTYYPGTPNIADAQVLTVGTGETRSDIVLMLVPTRTAQISGIVVDGQGQPVKLGSVQAFPDANVMGIGMSGGPIRDGSFTISGVPPGEYNLRAMINRPAADTPPEFATASITVTGADISGVRLAPVKPVTLAGRIVVSASAAAALRPEAFRFIAAPRVSGPMMFGPPPRPEPAGADLSFQV